MTSEEGPRPSRPTAVSRRAQRRIFAERRARADLAEFDRILNREGGAPPREGDELPPDLLHLGPAR